LLEVVAAEPAPTQVLQLTALDKPFGDHVRPYRAAQRDNIQEYKITDIKEGDVNVETMGVGE